MCLRCRRGVASICAETENLSASTPSRRELWRRVVYRYPLQVMGKQILVESPLVGRHQLRNVALAIAAAEELSKQGFAGITR